MSIFTDIQINLCPEEKRKTKLPDEELVFGKTFTDHMFFMEYKDEKWSEPKIIPYQSFQMDPASAVFHYGQEIFEGMKAFRHPDDSIHLFRPYENAERFNLSADRMSMVKINKDLFVTAIKELILVDNEWVPRAPGTTLYIRPTMIASEVALGVHPSLEYYFYIILAPVGPYFKEGFKPTKAYVAKNNVRAAPGGTGEAKTGGNYAATLYEARIAQSKGYPQVIWLDAVEKKYIEEASAMNIMFVINNEIYTPPLDGTILRGITRKSVLELATNLGYKIHEVQLDINQIVNKIETGECSESFFVGTAASITPVSEIFYNEKEFKINNGQIGKITQHLYDELTGIQFGKKHDRFNWMIKVK
jgi:branched-chain amino acid aminotransferase